MEELLHGFALALTPQNLLAALVGALIGTAVGVLPGLGPTGAMAILLPSTIALPPETSLIMLAGIFYGSQYGGSTTAILVNLPGEASSMITTIDGYAMAQKGRAGAALAIAAVGSLVAGTAGVFALAFAAPQLANVAIAFGPPEYFLLAVMGLAVLTRLSTAAAWKSAVMVALGLALSTVGQDPLTGSRRFTFDYLPLDAGIGLVPVLMGVYGLAEILKVTSGKAQLPRIGKIRLRQQLPTREEARRSVLPVLRATAIGFPMGLVPGPTPLLSTFVSYRLEKRLSKNPDEFGRGAVEGVAGPEAANNAATSGTFAPLLALGLPFTGATALLLAGMQIQGVQTGPLLITTEPDVFWALIASMSIGNVVLLVLNLPLIGLWTRMLRVPQGVFVAVVVVLLLVGTFALRNSMFDVIVLLVAGVIAWRLREHAFDMAPLVLGLVLGPVMEAGLRRSLQLSQGDLTIFVSRPLSAVMVAVIAVALASPPIVRLVRRARTTTMGAPHE